jgi:tRNA-specific 2-thiouridylase
MLKRALFPIGDLPKDEVRAEAVRFGLPVSQKAESVEICFVPDDDYGRVVRERRPEANREGEIVDTEGHVVGRHSGVANYTIGQRRGLGVAAGRPVYVTRLDAESNTVVLGDREHLMRRSLIARDANFFVDAPGSPLRCSAKIRYQHPPAPCSAQIQDDGRLRVDFDDLQDAITPGQAVVLYDRDVVLGGGWIDSAC